MKRVLIFGATSAIVEATTRLFASNGDSIFLVGRSESKLASVGADLKVRGAGRVGTAILEAMAMKKPVVASRVGGIPDSVLEAETGYLVVPGDSVDLSRKISGLLDNSQKAEQMGKAGRYRIEKEFILQVMAQKTERLYKDLLNRSHSERLV